MVDELDFLTCDHVNGDGHAHRELHKLGTGAGRLWRWVLKHPEERAQFQVLCCNCNHSKGTGKHCKLFGQSHVAEPRRIPIVKYDPTLPTLEA